MRLSWDAYFMAMLPQVAERSHDTTKTSCIIIGPDHEIRSTGYNGLPRGVHEDKPERLERPEKYFWMEHAERNAIYNAARVGTPLAGCTIYLNWYPCMDCARAVIQSGIVRLVCEKTRTLERWNDPKWAADFRRVGALLVESGVLVEMWDGTISERYEAA
jgi:dCMP deaminase